MRRRLLSLCLVLCMVLGMLPVMAMAAEPVKITVKAGEAEYEASCVDAGSVYAVQIPEATAVTIGKTDAAAGDYTAANVSGGLLVSFQEYPLELTAEELSKCILTDAQKANCGDVGIDLSIGNWACILLSDGEEQQNLFLLLGDAGVMAVDAKEIPVANNVIDITDKELYKRSSSIYINAVNITVSGADVTSATEDGTTVSVQLDAATAMDAAVSVTVGTSRSGGCEIFSGSTGTVTLENGEGTLNLAVKGGLSNSGSWCGTVNYTINFKVDAELTEVPTRLVETDAKEAYTGVAVEIGLKEYFKNAATYYLVEGENLTELEGKSYTFTPAERGTHTLTFAAGNVVGMCTEYVTVTVEATELESGIWVLHKSSSGSFNYIQFTDGNDQPIDGLTASIEGTTVTVALPQTYALNGKIKAVFNLTQNASGYPFLSTKTAASGTSSSQAASNKVSAMSTTLSNGAGNFSVYYFNEQPKNSGNYVTFTVNYKIFNNIPAFAEGVTGTEEKTMKAVTDTYSVDLSKLFNDKDEQALTYKVSVNDGAYTACDAAYSFNTDLAGTYVLKFKANDGQDDSQDIYTATITVENSDETYAVPVNMAEDVEGLTFYADSLTGEALTYENGSVQVPLNVKTIWWKTADGMTGTAAVADGFKLNLQKTTFVVKTVLGDVDSGSKITVTDPDGNTVAGNGFVYLLDSGKGYTYKATASISGWAANTLTDQTVTEDLTATVEVTLAVNSPKTVTADKGAEVHMYYQSEQYIVSEVKLVYTIDNDDTVTHVFSCPNKQDMRMAYMYFAKMEGKIDKAGYMNEVTDAVVTWVGEERTGSYRGAYDISTTFGSRGNDSVYVNVNGQNHLVQSSGTFRLRSFRLWQIINSDTNNVMLEPEFTYTRYGDDIFTLKNVTNKTSGTGGNNWVDLTVTGSGVAYLEVGYEAVHIVDGYEAGSWGAAFGQTNNFTYNAVDPTRTALIVVQTDGKSASDVTFGITNNYGKTWDAEFDTLYFTGERGKLTFTPSATSGISKVEISNNKGASFATITADDNGAYTADIVPGNNVIRITNGNGQTAYQVVRGDKISVTITNITEGKKTSDPIKPGDTVRINFTGLHAPIGKMSGIYNANTHRINYQFDGTTVQTAEDNLHQYDFQNYSWIDVVIPVESMEDCTLTGGYISCSGYGDYAGDHRKLTDNGRPQNYNDMRYYYNVILPDVEIPVEVESCSVTLTEGEGYTITAAEGSENPVNKGGSFSFTVAVNEGYEGTPVVKAGEVELTAVDGVYTVENINENVTITVEGITKAETKPDIGNLDGDGDVDVFDAALVYNIVNGLAEATEEQLAIADVNDDGVVNVFDAALLYAYVNGKLSAFPGQN